MKPILASSIAFFYVQAASSFVYGLQNPGIEWTLVTKTCDPRLSLREFNLNFKNHNIHIDNINITLDNI